MSWNVLFHWFETKLFPATASIEKIFSLYSTETCKSTLWIKKIFGLFNFGTELDLRGKRKGGEVSLK